MTNHTEPATHFRVCYCENSSGHACHCLTDFFHRLDCKLQPLDTTTNTEPATHCTANHPPDWPCKICKPPIDEAEALAARLNGLRWKLLSFGDEASAKDVGEAAALIRKQAAEIKHGPAAIKLHDAYVNGYELGQAAALQRVRALRRFRLSPYSPAFVAVNDEGEWVSSWELEAALAEKP